MTQRSPNTPESSNGDRPRYTRAYAVCTTPRSGSNLLCDLLTSSRVMGQPLEYFNVRSTIAPLASSNGLENGDDGVDMAAYVDYITREKVSPEGTFGTKILFSQLRIALEFEAGRNLLADPTTRYVLLIRRNVVAQAVSAYLARELDAWTLKAEEKLAKQGNLRDSVQYDREKIRTELTHIGEHNASWLEFFEVNKLDFMTVAYEDLLADPLTVCRSVCDYVGVETDYDFSLSRARVQKQGNELNKEFRREFASESPLSLEAMGADRPEEAVVKAAGTRLYEREVAR